MRKAMIALALVAGFGFISSPVWAVGDAATPNAHHNGILSKLNLTDAQQAAVKKIFEDANEQAKSAPDKEAAMKIHKDAWEKVKTTVLTDEQRTKLAELKSECAAKQHKHEHSTTEPTQ